MFRIRFTSETLGTWQKQNHQNKYCRPNKKLHLINVERIYKSVSIRANVSIRIAYVWQRRSWYNRAQLGRRTKSSVTWIWWYGWRRSGRPACTLVIVVFHTLFQNFGSALNARTSLNRIGERRCAATRILRRIRVKHTAFCNGGRNIATICLFVCQIVGETVAGVRRRALSGTQRTGRSQNVVTVLMFVFAMN